MLKKSEMTEKKHPSATLQVRHFAGGVNVSLCYRGGHTYAVKIDQGEHRSTLLPMSTYMMLAKRADSAFAQRRAQQCQ